MSKRQRLWKLTVLMCAGLCGLFLARGLYWASQRAYYRPEDWYTDFIWAFLFLFAALFARVFSQGDEL